MSYYKCLLLVDFVCLEGRSREGTPAKDIIEFAWVVYDTERKAVVDNGCVLLEPEDIVVTDDMLAHLGLRKEDLNTGLYLGDAIQKFDAAMFNQVQETRKPVTIGCFGVHQFVKILRELAEEKDVSLFTHYSYYINIAQLLVNHFTQLRNVNMNNIHAVAQALGVEIMGTKQNGLDACYTMANLLTKYLETGVITKEHNVLAGAEKTSQPAPVAEYCRTGAYLRCRGCPWDITEEKMVEFIGQCAKIQPSNVKIVVGADGRTTGEVYVCINSPEERDACIRELHGKMIGRRWIEVFSASEDEVFRANKEKRNLPLPPQVETIPKAVEKNHLGDPPAGLRLRGLPWSSNEYEVVKFFADGGFHIGVEDVVMGYAENNRLTGEAWVVMPVGELAEKAKTALNRKMMGRRYIELFLAPPAEIQQARNQRGHCAANGPLRSAQSGGGPPPQFGFTVLRMRGLPYHANEQHICEFFAGHHMIAILPSTAPQNGRPTGEAYVQFFDAHEAWKAFQRCNGSLIDRRYIELFAATKAEMDYAASGADPRTIRERQSKPY